MKELYQLEVEKGNTRVLKEYLSCNVIWNSATGVLRGFANRKNRTSLEAEIYISGFFDRKMNRLTILEVTKLRFRKPTLYVFKDIYKEGIKVNTKITKKGKIKITNLDNFLLYRIVKVFYFI